MALDSAPLLTQATTKEHLRRSLYGRRRDKDFRTFLERLLATIEEEQVDVLLVSGDVLNTTTPSHWAQDLYDDFLYNVDHSCCEHTIITTEASKKLTDEPVGQ